MDIQQVVNDRIVRKPETLRIIGVSDTTLWRMRRRREFPEPIRVSRGAIGWRLSTVMRWLDDRERAADVRSTS